MKQEILIQKLDKLDDRLDKVDKELVKYNGHLKEHMRRTNLLEISVEEFKKIILQAKGMLKLLATLGTIISIAFTIYNYK